MTEFFNMGGYAGFVWPAWAVALAVLTLLIAVSLKSMRTNERELETLEAASPRRRRRSSATDDGQAE